LNHQLRGAASDKDELAVSQLYASLVASGAPRLRLCCHRMDVAAAARGQKQNLEAVARRLRYAWLADVALQEGVAVVATAHTANDQAETVLHRLLRGTGIGGLRGVAFRRRLASGVEVVRPFLGVTRDEVIDYLLSCGQSWREDGSNLDLGRTRNRIRRELLPHLSRIYNPAIISVLCRLAEQAAAALAPMEEEAASLVHEAELPRAGSCLVFDRQRLASAPRHLVREAFRLAWARERWPLGGMDFAHWDRLAAIALGEVQASDLPSGMRACGLGRTVRFGPGRGRHNGPAVDE
jgi:tRNA(Ile)-lysidine synthase